MMTEILKKLINAIYGPRSPIFPKAVRNNGFQICTQLLNLDIIICVYILRERSIVCAGIIGLALKSSCLIQHM